MPEDRCECARTHTCWELFIEKLESILVMGSECGNKSRPTEIKHSFSQSLETFPKYRNAIFLPACLNYEHLIHNCERVRAQQRARRDTYLMAEK